MTESQSLEAYNAETAEDFVDTTASADNVMYKSEYNRVDDEYHQVLEENSEWNKLDEWQNQIENDFDFIYETLQKVDTGRAKAAAAATNGGRLRIGQGYAPAPPRSSSLGSSTRASSFTPRLKKSVAFDDQPKTTVIDEYDYGDEVDHSRRSVSGTYTNGFGTPAPADEVVEEEEYLYGGLLRPVSHRPPGTAKSFEHFLNTVNLDQSVRQVIKSPTADEHVRVRRHRRRTNAGGGGARTADDGNESDYSYTAFDALESAAARKTPTLSPFPRSGSSPGNTRAV